MRSYKEEIAAIHHMLEEFLDSGRIDAKKLEKMDNVISWSEEDQITILNRSYLPLSAQRSFFGAVRNVNMSMKKMKERLDKASELHENPTTAELAMELMPSLSNLAPYIDSLINESKLFGVRDVVELSRILYKKAMRFGFYQDVGSQLRDAGVTGSQIKSFIDRFSKNVALELDIEEEVSSPVENSS